MIVYSSDSSSHFISEGGMLPMDAKYSRELYQAFVVGEEELKKLVDLLADRVGNVSDRGDGGSKPQRLPGIHERSLRVGMITMRSTSLSTWGLP
jgi:hypothetical protein